MLAAGRTTFSSYMGLADSAVHMLGADYLLRHGQEYAQLDLRNSYGLFMHSYYGTGYPSGARAEAIPVQSRMMTIADIYDALTAADRPYKKALRAEEALAILDAERRAGALDSALLDLFIEARVFERVARPT